MSQEKTEQTPAVLVAVDFSPASDEAIRQADERAKAQGADLVACHVVPSLLRINILFPQRGAEQSHDQLALAERAREMLVDRILSLTGRDTDDFTPIVVEGTPHGSLIDQAERASASLIVVGGHGYGERGDVGLGSVAERVLRYAHCPVLVARRYEPGARIVVATDLSDPSMPALAAAAHEAKRTSAEVTALHCFEVAAPIAGPEYGVVFAPALPPELVAQARHAARERLEQAAQQVGLRAELRIADGPPATTIVSTAHALGAGLLVVGTHGRTGLRRIMLGSVAEAIARSAQCSLLVVRLSNAP